VPEWDDKLFTVFDDLEQQADALFDAERDLQLADLARAEYAEVTLASRLMAAVDHEVALDVEGVGRLEGRLTRVAAEWVMLTVGTAEWVVPLVAVTAAALDTDRSVPEVAWSAVARRLGLRSALRRLAESAEECVVHSREGVRYQGRIERVGQDFVELRTAPTKVQLIPVATVAGVQSWE
jgi:hypothetical protein